MKKIDKKSKPEQLFVLMLLAVACLGVFALTGCGGSQSCETVQCNSVDNCLYLQNCIAFLPLNRLVVRFIEF